MQITSVRKRIPPRLPLHARSPGFTLLELMVAIAIFSLIAVMAYGGLNAVTKQSTILAEQELEIRRIQGG
ncbi:MAG TPA: prepilin-type N-terminal cleavage/methylation domain-containing protein, partial [Halothiobacillus sp.]|nr:prepilin-type N-terminal cleavage/methylation domain-containing protein [Halothiobacillus sp.]